MFMVAFAVSYKGLQKKRIEKTKSLQHVEFRTYTPDEIAEHHKKTVQEKLVHFQSIADSVRARP